MWVGWGDLGLCVQSSFGRRQHAEPPLEAGLIAVEQFRVFLRPGNRAIGYPSGGLPSREAYLITGRSLRIEAVKSSSGVLAVTDGERSAIIASFVSCARSSTDRAADF